MEKAKKKIIFYLVVLKIAFKTNIYLLYNEKISFALKKYFLPENMPYISR